MARSLSLLAGSRVITRWPSIKAGDRRRRHHAVEAGGAVADNLDRAARTGLAHRGRNPTASRRW